MEKIVVIGLSIIDMILTHYYVYKYKKFYPQKPYSKMELNPLLYKCWSAFGLETGGVLASIIIVLIISGIVFIVSPLFNLIFIVIFTLANLNTIRNISLLRKLKII